MITYKPVTGTWIEVYLDKKQVGSIYLLGSNNPRLGWQYFPKGDEKGGEIFTSLILCKKSLEDEQHRSHKNGSRKEDRE